MAKHKTLLEAVRDYIYEFQMDHPNLAMSSESFIKLKLLVKEHELRDPMELHWDMTTHYNQLRFYPANYAAQQFMQKFMKRRECLLQRDLTNLEEVLHVRNIINTPKKPRLGNN